MKGDRPILRSTPSKPCQQPLHLPILKGCKLIELALMHKSYINDAFPHDPRYGGELRTQHRRLAHLGDSIMNAALTDYLNDAVIGGMIEANRKHFNPHVSPVIISFCLVIGRAIDQLEILIPRGSDPGIGERLGLQGTHGFRLAESSFSVECSTLKGI